MMDEDNVESRFEQVCYELGLDYSLKRFRLTQTCGALMSVLSEELYCAGWMIGFEESYAEYLRDRLRIEDLGMGLGIVGDEKELQNQINDLYQQLGHIATYRYDKDINKSYYIPFLV